MSGLVLVIDQGTTSTRAILFDASARPIATAQTEFRQIYPHPGWVEHDPQDLIDTTRAVMAEVIAKAGVATSGIAAFGLTNQRETTVIWNRRTGKAIHNAIVWQDRRTSETCARLKAEGHELLVSARTGLLLDPYFSATKIGWILDHVEGARAAAEAGDLAFGTVDSFLLWHLTNGALHATDATNAGRTMLLDIHRGIWDADLLALFGVPKALLPEVRDTAGDFGHIAPGNPAAGVAIRAIAGDQHAALIGQNCLTPGMVKATFGTGAFLLLNTGETAVPSRNRLLTTIAFQWGGKRHYALEGAIFSAGATVQWLRDGLGIIGKSSEAGDLAAEADPDQSVYLVPAFTGIGAPYWNSEARALVVGISRGTTRKELARAALESVGYQTHDLVAAMQADIAATSGALRSAIIRVDGGLSASNWTMQFLADILGARVDRPQVLETTALGVGLAAGWQAGIYPEPGAFEDGWRLDRAFEPTMDDAAREIRLAGWRDAVARTLMDRNS